MNSRQVHNGTHQSLQSGCGPLDCVSPLLDAHIEDQIGDQSGDQGDSDNHRSVGGNVDEKEVVVLEPINRADESHDCLIVSENEFP